MKENKKDNTTEREENLELEEDTSIIDSSDNSEGGESDDKDKLAEAEDKYMRLLAEFENYKRRTGKEKVELIQSAGKEVIIELLPTLDDFDRAMQAIHTAKDLESIKEGIDLVCYKFKKTLENRGLKLMDVIGKPFDSEIQEAITAIPAPRPDQKDKVLDVVEKGYTLNGKVIRFAKVVIGK